MISRLVLSMLLLPCLAFLYMVTFVVLDQPVRLRDEVALLIADLVCLGLMFLVWTAIWFRAVRWTPGRTVLTLIVTVLVAGLSAGIAYLIAATVQEELGILSWGAGTGTLWPVAMVLVWRESSSERRARLASGLGSGAGGTVRCLVCGYDMSGLTDARCPECGARFTLDRLVAARRDAHGQSIEAS